MTGIDQAKNHGPNSIMLSINFTTQNAKMMHIPHNVDQRLYMKFFILFFTFIFLLFLYIIELIFIVKYGHETKRKECCTYILVYEEENQYWCKKTVQPYCLPCHSCQAYHPNSPCMYDSTSISDEDNTFTISSAASAHS